MNFDLTDEQEVVRDLAAQIFDGQATTERVKQVEATDGFDRALWDQLARSGIQALFVPEEYGGSAMGMVEAVLVLQAQGRRVAPVPLWSTLVVELVIAEHGTAEQQARYLPALARGELVATVALAEAGANDLLSPATNATPSGAGLRLQGTKPAVPYGQHADVALVTATLPGGAPVVAIVDIPLGQEPPGVQRVPVTTTNHEPQAHLELDTVIPQSQVLGGGEVDGTEVLRSLAEHSIVALAALQVGVAEGSLALTAQHLATRHQFGRPLAAFQATTQRAADAYITTEAMRVTTINAAWRLASGFDARRDVAVAAYWATDGAQQVVLAGQHLHGGIGADVDYPVHRYFLWGTQLATVLGSTSSHLARLGQLIART